MTRNLNYDTLLTALRDAILWEQSYCDSWAGIKDVEADAVRADSTKKITDYRQQMRIIHARRNGPCSASNHSPAKQKKTLQK